MSSFYSREFHAKKNTADEELIFRWLQLMERHCNLYNVDNKHDCIRADREEKERAHRENNQPPLSPIIVQPFHSVENFYGCLVCGKYHICRLRRETCQLVVDKVDKQKVCAYSGQLLYIQDNLEMGNFETERSMDQEATLIQTTRSLPQKNIKKNTSRKGHIAHLLKETQQQQQSKPSLKRSRPTTMTKTECRVLLGDTYDLSVESASSSSSISSSTTSDDEEEDHDEEEDYKVNVEEEEDEDDDVCEKHAKRQRTVVIYQESSSSSSDNDGDNYIQDEGEEGSGAEYENENNEGGHAKNYHNNIRYKNEYYAFLQHTLRKQRKTEHHMSRYEKFIDLYTRDMNEATPATTTQEKETTFFASLAKLSDSVCEKIESEVTAIVDRLFGMDKTERPHCQLKPSKVRRTLVAYYVALIKNITLLVYHSPHLNKVAMKRATKNHTQTTKFALSVVDEGVAQENDVTYHEFTLAPMKIVRSVLLHLFTKTFCVGDSLGFNVNIWSIDRWLRLFVTPNNDRLFLATYHRQCVDYPTEEETDRYCKEIHENAALVEKCLRYYRFCPLWLRSMVFLHIV